MLPPLMVEGAQAEAVVHLIATPLRSVSHVMFLQVAAGGAARRHAAPSIPDVNGVFRGPAWVLSDIPGGHELLDEGQKADPGRDLVSVADELAGDNQRRAGAFIITGSFLAKLAVAGRSRSVYAQGTSPVVRLTFARSYQPVHAEGASPIIRLSVARLAFAHLAFAELVFTGLALTELETARGSPSVREQGKKPMSPL